LLSRLRPWAFERLWLMDPRNIGLDAMSLIYLVKKYEGGAEMEGAGEEVRLIDTGSLWTAVDEPRRTNDFEYPSFRLFEEMDEH
jgi:hypothetical protein